MVGDPGIEPGVRLREGVTVPCHTLRPVAHCHAHCAGREGVITSAPKGVKAKFPCDAMAAVSKAEAMKKPKWVVEKEQAKKAEARDRLAVWFACGARCVDEPGRVKLRLIVTLNAQDKLADAIAASGMTPEVVDPRNFTRRLIPGRCIRGPRLRSNR